MLPIENGTHVALHIAATAAARQCQGLPHTYHQAARDAARTLAAEARTLLLGAPDPATVDAWFADAHRHTDNLDSPLLRRATHQRLRIAERAYHENPATLTAETFHVWVYAPSLTAYTATRAHNPAPLTIAADADGCLYDFTEVMRDWLIDRCGWSRQSLPDPQVYSLSTAWGLPGAQMVHQMRLALHEGVMFRTGPVLADGQAGFRTLGQAGHRIIINSARNLTGMTALARTATLLWARDHDIHPDGLHLADPIDATDKLSVPFDLLIDDHPENVATALAAGRGAVLLDRGWNGGYPDLPRATYAQIAADPHSYLPQGALV